jgi:hypothetical protein
VEEVESAGTQHHTEARLGERSADGGANSGRSSGDDGDPWFGHSAAELIACTLAGMCRALTVLCAAPDAERLTAIKRAAVGAQWELAGGALGVEELLAQIAERMPHVVVIDGLPPDAAARARATSPTIRILVVSDSAPGIEADADDEQLFRVGRASIREAILGLPAPGGPVRS